LQYQTGCVIFCIIFYRTEDDIFGKKHK